MKRLATLSLALSLYSPSYTRSWPTTIGRNSAVPSHSALPRAEPASCPTPGATTENVLWKRDLPGRGWSSPVVWGNKVFFTTVINLGETEETKKGLYFGGDRNKPIETPHQWKVFCLDLDTGNRAVGEAGPRRPARRNDPSEEQLRLRDARHRRQTALLLLWQSRSVLPRSRWQRRSGASSGRRTRRGSAGAPRPRPCSTRIASISSTTTRKNRTWSVSTPRPASKSGESSATRRAIGPRPTSGRTRCGPRSSCPAPRRSAPTTCNGNLLYEFGGMSSITIATPYEKDGLLYVSSGYVMDKKKPLLALRPGAAGRYQPGRRRDQQRVHRLVPERRRPLQPHVADLQRPDLRLVRSRAFWPATTPGPASRSTTSSACPKGKAFTSSPWAYNDKIFCANEDGKTFVIKAGKDFEILHTNDLEEDDMCMATPAIVGDKLILRTAARVYCLKQGAKLQP